MIQTLRITQVVENRAAGRGLLGEHGLSYFIEADDRCLLFDTGQGLTLPHNAKRLGLPMEQVEAIALSHGHYDHAGGLKAALELTGAVDLYLHPEALGPKHNRDGRDIGSSELAALVESGTLKHVSVTKAAVEMAPGVHLTGEIPRRHAIEDTGGPFYRDAARTEADELPDDQALYLETNAGLVVLLGCGHSGLVNTLEQISDLCRERRIHAVIGGTHLLNASEERLAFTAEALRRFDVAYLAPNHCTGLNATCYLRQALPGRCKESAVGGTHIFGGPSDAIAKDGARLTGAK